MIVVIEYGMGNPGSIANVLKKARVEAKISSSIEDLKEAKKFILPGVGSFAEGIKRLQNFNLVSLLNKKVLEEKIPILGICLGMQLFCARSEEGDSEGLKWIDADIGRFNFSDKSTFLKIPHVGWNSIKIIKNNPLFSNISSDDRFYFTHSYHVSSKDRSIIYAETNYGYDFPSVIQKENIIGTQFHPEKSHRVGVQLIKNFIENF